MEKRKYITEAREPLRLEPNTITIVAPPKTGKSAIVAKLTTEFAPGKAQLISLGKERGSDNLKVVEQRIERPTLLDPYLDDLIVDQPFDFLIFDNTSILNEWSELAGTIRYMASNAGRNFNLKARLKDSSARGPGFTPQTADQYFLPGHPNYQSVYTLPDGAGYRHGRTVFRLWWEKIKLAAPYIIMLSHPKIDRYTKDDNGKVVNTKFIDMTHGISKYFARDVDVIATMYRKRNKAFLSFKHGSDDTDGGSRYAYLSDNEYQISELVEGNLQTNWESIFPNYKI